MVTSILFGLFGLSVLIGIAWLFSNNKGAVDWRLVLTGITLGIAVATWALSPIKFQADMGILLAFMFVWNMVGALVLLPALAHFLLRPAARKATLLAEAA